MTFGRILLLLTTLFLCDIGIADNGHLIRTVKTSEYNVAVFAEPWPPRVGKLQVQFIITDKDGQLVQDDSILLMQGIGEIALESTGPHTFRFVLAGETQAPITFEVLPKASVITMYLPIWIFLIVGLIFIILREKLAKIHARRYPSL